jgi:sugar phosphate isomerase/epimerase
MRLSLPTWSLPSCTLAEAAGIARALGIPALDVGLFYRAALDKRQILADPAGAAESLAGLGIEIANYYHLFGDGLADRNLALPGTTDANARDLDRVLAFADAAGIPTVFVLPGVVNPGQSRAEAAATATAQLRVLSDAAMDHRARLCFEPHVHSWAESPALALRLAEETGVGIALDYAHFACLGYRQDEIDVLAPHAVHVHLRQARMGALQAKFAQGTLNFSALFGTLRDAGYTGALALEAVHQDYMNTVFDDVLTEVVALRDAFYHWRGVD